MLTQRRSLIAWVLYDCGYSAYSSVIATFVFATYFTQAVAADPILGAAQWGRMQAVAGVAVALLAVPLGAIADRGGGRRVLLAAATVILAAAALSLWTVHPHAGQVPRALVLAGIGAVALEVGTVFYNSMLPELAAPGRLGRLSMLAWAAGYGGGLICLTLCLVGLVLPANPPFGLSRAMAEPVRACALLAGIWIVAFCWPLLAFAPKGPSGVGWLVAVRAGLAGLRPVARDAWSRPVIRRFLLARLLFTDGIVTLFAFGGIYAAATFGMSPTGVLLFGIGLTLTAGLGALAAAFIEDRLGAWTTTFVSVVGLAVLGAAILLVRNEAAFWVLGLMLGVFVGPSQAASRSLMARLAPAEARAAYFGLFALSGRVTAFVGPLSLAAVTQATGSLSAGMAVIVVLLVAGAAILLTMPRSARAAPAPPPVPTTPVAA